MTAENFKKGAVALTLAASMAMAMPVLATNSERGDSNKNINKPAKTIDVPCIQTAIEKRDKAIIAAADAYHTTVVAALNTRISALKAAWALTERPARRAAIRVAWTAYREALKDANNTLRTAKRGAWNMFRTDSKTCGNGVTSSETNYQGYDASL